jgi:hypothetical protein
MSLKDRARLSGIASLISRRRATDRAGLTVGFVVVEIGG